MNPSIATVAALYKMDNSFFQNGIGNLDNETAMKKVSDSTNPIMWMAGHLTSIRYHLLNLLGEKKEFPWPKLFDDGFDTEKYYPEMSKIADAWHDISDAFQEKLAQASESDLTKALDYKLPHGDNTVRGGLIFFAYHEAWHFGQMAYVRKCFGMEGLVPY